MGRPLVFVLLGVLGAASCARERSDPFVTYFSNKHGISVRHPSTWQGSQEERDGVWYRTFTATTSAEANAKGSATLFATAPAADLDGYADAYARGKRVTVGSEEKRLGLKGRSYSFESDGGARHTLLLLAPDGSPEAADPGLVGLDLAGDPVFLKANGTAFDEMSKSLSLERSSFYPERKNDPFAFSLRVPQAWIVERTMSRGDTFLQQFKSPALAADRGGNTVHASLTIAVQKAVDIESYYKAVRDNLGDPFPVLSHKPWQGGYADVMRTETPVSESRIKRYFRAEGGRGYSLTCESREDVFQRIDRWCDIIASTLRIGRETSP